MNWFVWRQHRNQFMIFGLILAAFAVFTILTGNHFWHAYQQALGTCKQNPATPSCSDLHNSLSQSYGVVVKVVFLTGLSVPLILGLFLGSPLFSKEYEEGTNKLAWTQSVSRRKWLTTKLVWALAFAALYGLAISLLVSWWARTGNVLDHSRFDTGQFDVQGMMPFAFSVFFTVIGFTMSAWFRKTIIALAVTLGLFIAFQASVGQWLRPHYMTPVTVTSPMGPGAIDLKIPAGAWVLSRNIVDKNDKTFNSFNVADMPQRCQEVIQQSQADGNGQGGIRIKVAAGPESIDACLNNAGYHQIAKYQPPYRYWNFQRIETGMYLGMAALATGVTYLLILKRDA
ncbi:MAG TPA: ABC transporter permease subunit [Candidatus Saccharimonadales bacterium]|jgi:ABC-type transport system involved in multi-copper enzyme maturation permease subunit|nr:ABC transporter permease subunit [Candidatus Saccharimonadales bacterium]